MLAGDVRNLERSCPSHLIDFETQANWEWMNVFFRLTAVSSTYHVDEWNVAGKEYNMSLHHDSERQPSEGKWMKSNEILLPSSAKALRVRETVSISGCYSCRFASRIAALRIYVQKKRHRTDCGNLLPENQFSLRLWKGERRRHKSWISRQCPGQREIFGKDSGDGEEPFKSLIPEQCQG